MRAGALQVKPDASIAEAIATMLDNGVSGMPVVDASGALVGILTEGDLLHRAETGTIGRDAGWVRLILRHSSAGEYVRTHSRRVADLMTRVVITVAEDTPLEEVVELMERKHVKRLPVLRGDKLVGIVSRADLVRALGQALARPATDAETDEAIRERLFSELRSESWFRRLEVACKVRDGVVTFTGRISDEAGRAALRVAASNVPGVTQVRDELVWVEPAAEGLIF
ncbi:MAG: CBS domain-containing protein [Acetobacteraceae bacterium]|nr:CBS domain-containing protein [Acetobacteraceae bacterium]